MLQDNEVRPFRGLEMSDRIVDKLGFNDINNLCLLKMVLALQNE